MYCENGKIQYPDCKSAGIAAAQLGRTYKKQKFSFYKCKICGFFHTNTVKSKKMLTPKKIDKYPVKYIQELKNQQLHPIPVSNNNKKGKQNKKRGRKNRRNS